MDGLAGGLAIVGLGTLALGATLAGQPEQAMPVVVLVAVIGGFLLFNLPLQFNRPVRAFMGDAGSTFLGFSIAWFGVQFSQGEGAPLKPIMILWASSVPLMELFSSSIRRLAAGRSPLSADADHFHHSLVRAGFSVRATFLTLIGLEILLSTVGFALTFGGVSEHVSFMLFVTLTVTASIALVRPERLLPLLPRTLWRERRGAHRAPQPVVQGVAQPDTVPDATRDPVTASR